MMNDELLLHSSFPVRPVIRAGLFVIRYSRALLFHLLVLETLHDQPTPFLALAWSESNLDQACTKRTPNAHLTHT
jgi:hypothetical protein